jgi:hypothetical protein
MCACFVMVILFTSISAAIYDCSCIFSVKSRGPFSSTATGEAPPATKGLGNCY